MAQQFESLKASSLYCNKCREAMPVRERLLLILPDKEVYDYLCTGCGNSLGTREVSLGELRLQALTQGLPPRPRTQTTAVRPPT